MSNQGKLSKYNIYNILYVALFVVISSLLLWKCRFGYATLDEAFYPTIAYRFIQGDAILSEEWNNTQLSNLILIPILKCYINTKGNLDGIYLAIRYMYTVCKILISMLIYYKLRYFGKHSAQATSLIFLIFAGYGMMVLSYNSVASGGLLCALLFCINYKSDSIIRKDVNHVLAGISLAAAVLAQPYLAVLYFLYVIYMFCKKLTRRDKEEQPELYTGRTFLGVTVGIAISIILFCVYVFSKTDISSIIQALPHIIAGDPAHPKKSFYQMTLAYFVRIVWNNNRNLYLLVIYGLLFLFTVICHIDKKHEDRINGYVISAVLLCLALMGVYIFTDSYINYIIWIPNILALILFSVFRNQEMKYVFLIFWIPGMIYTYLEYLASNTGFAGISSASCVATVGSILMIGLMTKTTKLNQVSVKTLQGFVAIIMIVLLYYRLTYVFWEDGGMPSLTKQIQFGPDAGLMVTEQEYRYYEDIYGDTLEIRELPSETQVVFLSDKSLWLAGTQQCASYSPLCYSITNTELLYQYYEEHPEKKADIIYVDYTYGQEVAETVADRLNMAIKPTKAGWILEGEK